MKRKFIFILVSVAIIGVSLFFFFIWKKENIARPDLPTHEAMLQKSEHFRKGYGYYESRQMNEALSEFQLAKNDISNRQEKGLVALLIGLSMERSGDRLRAIDYLKAMGENPDYTNEARAYAIQYLGRMYFTSYDPAILEALYSTKPYSDFYQEKDLLLATRRLYEYGSAYQPLAFSEIRIAALYLNEANEHLVPKAEGNAAARSLIEENIRLAKTHIEKADQDIEKLRGEGPASQKRLPEIYIHKAIVLTDMRALGDTSLGDPEPVFRMALAEDAKYNALPDSIMIYNYALFLAKNDPVNRKEDIHNLLSRYSNGFYRNSTAERSFTSARTNLSLQKTKNGVILLASLDPEFKKYILGLGWTESDFEQTGFQSDTK